MTILMTGGDMPLRAEIDDHLDECPFCGCEVIETDTARAPDEGYVAVCTLCNAQGPLCETAQAAIEAWNERS